MKSPGLASLRELREVALVFLKLGATAFGGPVAHIAMMEAELVGRRQWVTPERFLDLLSAANLIPGPSSTELAIYLGYERAGWRGLIVGGVCFIAPAALIVSALAWAYVHFGTLPALTGVLYGIKPIVIGIVFQALWGLVPKAIRRSALLAAVGVAAAIAAALSMPPLTVLLSGGIVTAISRRLAIALKNRDSMVFAPALVASSTATLAAPKSVLAILLTFAKLGVMVFGSGYALLVFLRSDLVDRLHWVTERELLDAVAVGQVTPGPVFTTATFLGYLIDGARGAFVATLGIFLPAFLLVAITRPLLPRIRKSITATAFLEGVNAASVALMAVVGCQLARTALVDVTTCVLGAVGAILLVRFKTNSTWLIAGAAIVGLIHSR